MTKKHLLKRQNKAFFQYKTGLQIKINMLKLDKRRQIFYDKKAVSELNKERWKKLAQKAGDKIRQGSLRLAMLMTTLIGNGSATGSNPPAESSSSSEKTTITAPAVKTERADSIDTVDMTQLMSEQLISSNKNIAGNFNLEGRTFTAEELAEIGQCELNEQIQKTAQKTAKRGDMRMLLNADNLAAFNHDLAKAGIRTADKMTLKDLKKHEKEQQRLTAEILRERRQRD